MSERVLHCWKDRKTDIEERFGYLSPEHVDTYQEDFQNGTCMLPEGHEGPHEFTSDSNITITFAAATAKDSGEKKG